MDADAAVTAALGGTIRAGQSLGRPADDGGIAASQRVLRARLEQQTLLNQQLVLELQLTI